MDSIPLYEAARRHLIALWIAKVRLLNAAQARFPTSHPTFKALQRVCHNDATCRIRYLADNSACMWADRFGDELFRKEVDGVRLPAATHWFYGISDLLPRERVTLDRTKRFTASDVECLETMGKQARKFIDSVKQLPFVPAKELKREEHMFERYYAKAK